jgi:hypothetical protein
MRPQTRVALREFYAEPNRRLERRLGRPMGWQSPDSPLPPDSKAAPADERSQAPARNL